MSVCLGYHSFVTNYMYCSCLIQYFIELVSFMFALAPFAQVAFWVQMRAPDDFWGFLCPVDVCFTEMYLCQAE
jgi:hypothetical protein